MEYFEQITAERVKVRYVNGYIQRTWEKSPGQRNEALDARVNAYAALHSLYQTGFNLNREADRLAARIAERQKPIEERKGQPGHPFLSMPKSIVSTDPWL